jgi:magnesium transporter
LNLFNAALVTPTYYVFFTSATIVSSAILFQGFKGTPISISTVAMGFFQICAGVILLQLSKSAKDVPDTTVLKSGLDQVRTVAEQEEPESEPRADTIRGSAALLRALSVSRQKREAEEAKRIQEEHMQPIGEGEEIQIDGLRRRKTIVQSGQQGLERRQSLHPPLGMSRFPDFEDSTNPDDDQPPESSSNPRKGGYTSWVPARLRSFSSRSRQASSETAPVQLDGLRHHECDASLKAPSQLPPHGPSIASQSSSSAIPIRKPSNADRTQHLPPPSPSSIQWDPSVDDITSRKSQSTPHLIPPNPPPHSATRRQFSLDGVSSEGRPIPRSSLSFLGQGLSSRDLDGTTEEERLGLVKGDSTTSLIRRVHDEDGARMSTDSEADDLPGYKSDPEEHSDDKRSGTERFERDRRKDPSDSSREKEDEAGGPHSRNEGGSRFL